MSSTKAPSTDLPTHSFACAADFETFLEHSGTTEPGIYLKLAKKGSGFPSITAAEAIEIALCFGWIDGRANSLGADYWTVRYTPRRAKSIWSQKNVATVGRLVEQGRMRPAGLVVVQAAKEDGRWERAYAGPATITVPDDLAAALADQPEAASFFEGMNKSDRYAVLWRVQTASLQGRAKRIEGLVQTLVEGKRPGAPTVKTARKDVVSKKKKAKGVAVAQPRPARKQSAGERPPAIDDHAQARQSRRAGLRRRL